MTTTTTNYETYASMATYPQVVTTNSTDHIVYLPDNLTEVLEVGQRWYVTIGDSHDVEQVEVTELTKGTIVLLVEELTLALFGINSAPCTRRYAYDSVCWIELLPAADEQTSDKD